jgi:hypothetical protein
MKLRKATIFSLLCASGTKPDSLNFLNMLMQSTIFSKSWVVIILSKCSSGVSVAFKSYSPNKQYRTVSFFSFYNTFSFSPQQLKCRYRRQILLYQAELDIYSDMIIYVIYSLIYPDCFSLPKIFGRILYFSLSWPLCSQFLLFLIYVFL